MKFILTVECVCVCTYVNCNLYILKYSSKLLLSTTEVNSIMAQNNWRHILRTLYITDYDTFIYCQHVASRLVRLIKFVSEHWKYSKYYFTLSFYTVYLKFKLKHFRRTRTNWNNKSCIAWDRGPYKSLLTLPLSRSIKIHCRLNCFTCSLYNECQKTRERSS